MRPLTLDITELINKAHAFLADRFWLLRFSRELTFLQADISIYRTVGTHDSVELQGFVKRILTIGYNRILGGGVHGHNVDRLAAQMVDHRVRVFLSFAVF